jgi:hypothetical protein
MFANVLVLLENLILREANDLFYVNLGQGSLYYDKKFGKNAWEYYFTQPDSQIVLSEIAKTRNTIESGFLFRHKRLLDFSSENSKYEISLKQASILFGSVFDFNDGTSSFLKQKYNEIFPSGEEFVGVHRRQTDSPFVPPIEEFFRKVDPFADKGFSVFLATDSKEALVKFKKRYGAKLYFIRGHRSNSMTAIHTSKSRFRSPAIVGRDVILDSYLMSRCQYLLRTRSNVTTFTRILNPNMPWSEV